jgi:hypothetical protein
LLLILGPMLLARGADDAAGATASQRSGEQIYHQMCMRCHGPEGEGVAGKYDEALVGDKSVETLIDLITRTMPEDEPGTCTGEDAKAVAGYVYEKFYSPEARARLQPARNEFSRLTVRQYRNAVADLVASFREPPEKWEPGGLQAEYFASKDPRRDKRVIERVDPGVEFTFEGANPDPKLIPGDEFAIRWSGSVMAEESGEYEFVVRTENGARLWVNDRSEPLIDEWVSSGPEVREHRKSITLLGGRAYPVKLEVFRFKDKTASVALQWKPPHGTTRTIPARSLSPRGVAETLVVTTPFPADDGSAGYERGNSVSKDWQQAVTRAAVEVADAVVKRLERLSDAKADAPDRQEKLKAFTATFAERAFRRPLTGEERAFFRDKPFEGAPDAETAVRRAVLLVLTSPRFLYPEVAGTDASAYGVATRLSLGLWDSLPDRPLLDAAASGALASPDAVAEHARRMLNDRRSRAKVRDFLHQWLHTEEAEDLSKDPAAYPDFNEEVLADLRTSLDLFLEAVVWGNEGSDYRQLLLADHLYLNDRLAKFLGVDAPAGGGFQMVSFDPAQRSGVLTHPYLLAALAYHKNSSPIHRGVFLTRNIVGRTLRPPPMAIQFMDDRFDPTFTMREKVTELTRSNTCMGCHAVINPLGFSLEHYDAVGRFRTTDNNKPVDATGDYPAADGTTIRLAGPRDVAEHAAASPDAHRAFVRQLFNHVAKQPVDAYGAGTLEGLRKSFADSNFNIQTLLVEIAKVSALHGGQTQAAAAPQAAPSQQAQAQ